MPDKFCALKYGPMPTYLYDAVKDLGNPNMKLSKELSEAIHFAGEDAPNVLLPNRHADLSYLSKSEINCLDESIREHGSMTFGELMQKSHDSAWDEAHRRVNGSNVISPVSMAKVMNADKAILDYIEEQMLIEAALR